MTEMRTTRPALWPEISVLLWAAMLTFVYTIGIGILNGADLVDFDRRRILGHVHGGTLGWLTLAVFAASLWLFGQDAKVGERERSIVRVLTGGAIVSFLAYVTAFSLTYGWVRPALGIASTVVIAGVLGWVAYRVPKTVLGVPQWGFLAALGTSVVGGVLGVLLGLQIATGDTYLPSGGEAAHPGTMVVGFLIPVALAMSEWAFAFPRPAKATRLGIIQMVFPFVGGILLMISLLLDIVPLAPIAVLLELVGVGIFVKRMWPNIRAVRWGEPTPGRHAVASGAFVIIVLGIAQYFIIRYEGDFDLVPLNQLLGMDHAQFIGAMTNAVFAMLLAATMPGARGNRADHVIFGAVNLGLAGFVIGLLFDVTVMKQIFAPLMGVGLLFALGVYASRLLPARAEAPELQAAPGG